METSPGRMYGPYRVIDGLGTGGMGEVLRALDTRLYREVAIKVLRINQSMPSLRERFLREARASSSLNHPNICTIFDIGQEGDEPYMVMELLRGEMLRDRIHRGPIPPAELIEMAIETADALRAAHEKGIIHRDIKPANIFLVPRSNGTDQVKMLDFGLAKVEQELYETQHGSHLTMSGATVGTVAYMSPEQARGEELDPRSDLFSLGAVLYEMATGILPFRGSTSALVFVELLGKDPEPIRKMNAKISPGLSDIIDCLLRKERSQRFPSAGHLYEALVALQMQPESSITAKPALPSSSSGTKLLSTSSPRVKGMSGSPMIVDPDVLQRPQSPGHAKRFRSSGTHASRVAVRPKAHYADSGQEHIQREPRVFAGAWKGILSVLLALLVIGGGVWLFKHRTKAAVATAGQVIQISPTQNSTGNASLGDVMTTGLEILLHQSPVLVLRGEDDYRFYAGSAADATTQDIAKKQGADLYLAPTISGQDGNYTLAVDVVRTETGEHVATEQESITNQQQMLDALSRLAPRLRSDLGEGDASITRDNMTLGQSATRSTATLLLYRAALQHRSAGDMISTAKSLATVVSSEPDFTHARLLLAWTQLDAGAEKDAAATLAPLGTKNLGTSDAYLQKYLASMLHLEADSAADTAHQWATDRASDSDAQLAQAQAFHRQGRFTDEYNAAHTAQLLTPSNTLATLAVEASSLALNRYEAVVQTAENAAHSGINTPGPALLASYALARSQDESELLGSATSASASIGSIISAAVFFDNVGQFTRGTQQWNLAMAHLSAEPSLKTAGPALQSKMVLNRAMAGVCPGIWPSQEELVQSGLDATVNYGLAGSWCGQAEVAEKAISLLNRQGKKSLATTLYLPQIQALMLLSTNGQGASEHLRSVRGGGQEEMTPLLRGIAETRESHADTAIVDLQTVLTNRGVALAAGRISYPVAQKRLTVAYSTMGDTANAAQAHAEFTKTWANGEVNEASLLSHIR